MTEHNKQCRGLIRLVSTPVFCQCSFGHAIVMLSTSNAWNSRSDTCTSTPRDTLGIQSVDICIEIDLSRPLRPSNPHKITRIICQLRCYPCNLPPPLDPHEFMFHPRPPITRFNNRPLLPSVCVRISILPAPVTSKLLPLNHNLVLGHAFDVWLSEEMLCCERSVAQVFGGEPFGCKFVGCVSLFAPGGDDGGVVYDYFGGECC